MNESFVCDEHGEPKGGEETREMDNYLHNEFQALTDEQGTCGGAPEGCVCVHHRTGPCIGWSRASRVQISTAQSRSRSSWMTDAAKSVEVRKAPY